MNLEELSYYCGKIREWLSERYGEEAGEIWKKVEENYASYLEEAPDYGGKKNGHASAIYGGMLVFALYKALPDRPDISELEDFIRNLFMSSFVKLGKVFDLNRSFDMWLIDRVFHKVGNRDRKDIERYPDGFVAVNEEYDRKNRVSRYRFTQCPNAEFAKKHGLLHVLPLLCNSDFFGIEQIHGTLIRCGTCGNSDMCDYCVMGNGNPIADEYETVRDDLGFLVSRKKV